MPPKKAKQQAAEHEPSEQNPPSDALPPPSNPLDVFSTLQSAAENGLIKEHTTQMLELMGAAEASTTPPIMRVRFLEFIARHLEKIDESTALKKIAASLVKIISSDDPNIDPILCAAIRCFESLGPISTADSSLEFLAREAVDILLQVTLDHGAFSFTVRKAGMAALDSLTNTAFRCVVTKLMHWLSDDREEDDEEQIRKERHTALSRLLRMALSPSMKKHWTQETEVYTLSLIQRIMQIVNVKEFNSLMQAASSLSSVREKNGVPLLELFISENQTLSDRAVESLAIIAKYVDPKAEFDLITYLQKCSVFQHGIPRSGDPAVFLSRVLLLASKISPSEACEPLIDFLFKQLGLLIGDGQNLNCDLSVLEALLSCLVHLSKKKEREILEKVSDESFRSRMPVLLETLSNLNNFSLFAIKKSIQSGKAGIQDAEVLACLENSQVIVAALAENRVPSPIAHESWSGKAKLPVLKRSREEEKVSNAVLPAVPGSSSSQPPRQKNRRMENSNRGRNRRY